MTACSFDFANPVDPDASNFEGILTVSNPSDLRAEKAWALPSDGSAEPVFVASKVLNATADFSGTLLIDTSAATGLAGSLVDGATYYWRARALKGDWGDWSEAASFVMKKVAGVALSSSIGQAGATGSAEVNVAPSDATCPMVYWSSSDSASVGVDARGTLSFKSPGSLSVVTATSVDGGFVSSNVASVLLSSSATTEIAGDVAQGSENGIGSAARFQNANSSCLVGGKLYLSDMGNNDIRCVDLATNETTRIAGNPGVAGSADGTGESAEFSLPQGICSDGTNLYVADRHYLGRLSGGLRVR